MTHLSGHRRSRLHRLAPGRGAGWSAATRCACWTTSAPAAWPTWTACAIAVRRSSTATLPTWMRCRRRCAASRWSSTRRRWRRCRAASPIRWRRTRPASTARCTSCWRRARPACGASSTRPAPAPTATRERLPKCESDPTAAAVALRRRQAGRRAVLRRLQRGLRSGDGAAPLLQRLRPAAVAGQSLRGGDPAVHRRP